LIVPIDAAASANGVLIAVAAMAKDIDVSKVILRSDLLRLRAFDMEPRTFR
jgi:hypothetical protein